MFIMKAVTTTTESVAVVIFILDIVADMFPSLIIDSAVLFGGCQGLPNESMQLSVL